MYECKENKLLKNTVRRYDFLITVILLGEKIRFFA